MSACHPLTLHLPALCCTHLDRRWALPLQLTATLYDCAPYARQVCSHPQTIPRVLHPLLRHAAQALSWATLALHPMLPQLPTASAGPEEDCHSIVLFLQATGFASAALFKARQEARLWEQHQAERQALGLPPEGGWHARVYAAVDALPRMQRPGSASGLLLSCCMLLITWQALMVCNGAGMAAVASLPAAV